MQGGRLRFAHPPYAHREICLAQTLDQHPAGVGDESLLLRRRDLYVNPSQPTTRLVTDGVFGHTRNPLYVGVSVALCGLALIFDLDWILLLIVPSFVLLHFAVVRREERYLEQKFGDAYRHYKARVPRYFAGN